MPLPTVGQALRVRTSQDAESFYRSRLFDITSENFLIELPLSTDGTPLARIPGDDVWIEFHALDGAMCYFTTRVEKTVERPMLAWRVLRPKLEEIKREQRREFVRVDVDIPVRIETSRGGAMQIFDVRSRDLSGGGIGLWLPPNAVFSVGSTIYCKFTLPRDDFPVDTQGVVVRMGERNHNGFAVGSVQFLKMHENIRQRIIQFTFWRQRFLSEMTGGEPRR